MLPCLPGRTGVGGGTSEDGGLGEVGVGHATLPKVVLAGAALQEARLGTIAVDRREAHGQVRC